jgi:RNA polymerase sigma factor (sigma-70 family)
MEDAAQDVYVYIMERIHLYKPELGHEFTTWAGALMQNFLKNRVRSENAPEVELVSEWEFSDESSDGSWIEETYTGDTDATADPADLLERDETEVVLSFKFNKLSPREQYIWVMRALEGQPYKEIAAHMGMTEQSARNLFQSAKTKML